MYDVCLDEIVDCFSSSSSVEEEADSHEAAKMIDKYLETLDQQSRIMFVRRYWHADSIADIANLFHTSKHNVSVRLYRIRKNLKKYLIEEGIFL